MENHRFTCSQADFPWSLIGSYALENHHLSVNNIKYLKQNIDGQNPARSDERYSNKDDDVDYPFINLLQFKINEKSRFSFQSIYSITNFLNDQKIGISQPLDIFNKSSKLTHGVENLLQGSHKSIRSVKEMNIASLGLPYGLSVCKLDDGYKCTMGVFNMKDDIQKGLMLYSNRQNLQEKEFGKNAFQKTTSVESLLSNPFSWLAYARHTESYSRSNLKLQSGSNVFVKSSKVIRHGEELFLCQTDVRRIIYGKKDNESKYVRFCHDEMEDYNPNGHQCQRCGKVFAYRYYRDKHLKYTRCVDLGDRKYPCHLCQRSFEKRDRLRIHVLHVHEKHRPHKCRLCGKSFSQSSSLNKHTRVHSGERPYECPYCTKAFTASSILRTHIRQHSGEKPFQCKYCGRTFASHAAHDSHVRRTHTITI